MMNVFKSLYFRSIFLLIILSQFSFFSYAQVSISGVIKDITTKEPVKDVNVVIEGTTTVTFSGPGGHYKFSNLKAGEYNLVFTHTSYEATSKKVNTYTDGITLDILLKPKVELMDPVQIKSHPLEPFNFIQTQSLAADIELSSVGDAGEYLRSLPNVSGIRKGGNGIDPVIRGFKFHQVSVTMDNGIMIPGGCPNRMDPTASHIPLEDIEKINVIRGPYALKFGVGLGGFVQIITSKPTPFKGKKLQYTLRGLKGYESNWNGSKDHLQLKIGNNKLYFNFTGNHMKYGNYKDGNDNTVRSQYNKYAWSAEMGFMPKMGHEILLTYNTHYNRHAYFPALPMDERIDDTRVVALSYKGMNISPKIKMINFKAFDSKVYHEMDNKERFFADTVVSVSKIDASSRMIGGGMGFMLGKGMLMAGAGYGQMYKDGRRDKTYIAQPPVNGEVPSKHEQLMDALITNQGTFAEYKIVLWGMDVAASARLDLNHATTEDTLQLIHNGITYYDHEDAETFYANFSASMGFNKQISKRISAGLALGRTMRSPNMLERFMKLLPVGYDNFDYLGDPKINPEVNHQADLSFRYNHPLRGTVELTGFYAYVKDYITSRRIPSTVIMPNSSDVQGVKQFYNTNAILTGFELSYATPSYYKLQLQLFASYTYGVMPEAEGYLIDDNDMPIGNITYKNDPVAEIPPFEATARISYTLLSDKLIPQFITRFAAPQKCISWAYHERSTPAFFVSNLNLKYVYSKTLTVAAGIHNLFNAAYYEHLNRRIVGGELSETQRVSNLYEPGRSFFVNMIVNI